MTTRIIFALMGLLTFKLSAALPDEYVRLKTDAEKFYLLEAQVGHGLFFAGQNHVSIRVVASYAEDQIITSDPRQLIELEQAKRMAD